MDRTFGLEELADAFRHQETGDHFGKIAVSW
ncbi:zinc-binding dehydrogenase [Sphingomonas sp. CCH5-D11]|nr:zinc-binding dehydrogenase [Sphingomonas sp. CCH5-D11]